MDTMQIIGSIMLAAPFVAIFVYGWAQVGFWSAAAVFAALGLLFGWVVLGFHLLGPSG